MNKEMLMQKSRILRSRLPESTFVSPGNGIYGLSELKNYLLDLTEDSEINGGVLLSLIHDTKEKITAKLAQWKYQNNREGLLPDVRPTGRLGQDLSNLEVRLAMYELEAEEIPKMIEKEEMKRY